MKKIIYILIILNLITPISLCNELDWDTVREKSVQNSFDVKIAETDVKITDANILGAKSEYYPKIGTYFYSEYTRSLDGNNQTVYIGNEVLYGNSVFQNSLSVGLNYNLFDFGIRGDKLKIAKEDKTSKIAQYDKILRDSKVKAVDAYAKSLLLYKQTALISQISQIRKELYTNKNRLYLAGKIPQTSVLEEKIKWTETQNELQKYNSEFEKSLKDLSYLTKEKYGKDVILKDFRYETVIKSENLPKLNRADIPETKIYDSEIKKKEKELLIAKKQNLPMFNFSTSYYLYGADPNNYFDAFGNFKQRGLKFRVIAALPIFDGFKNKSEREKLQLEIVKLNIEKEQKISEVLYSYEKMCNDAVYAERQIENNKKMKDFLNENIAMFDRLDKQKLIDKEAYLQQKINLLTRRFEIEKTDITEFVTAYKLAVMTKNKEENI